MRCVIFFVYLILACTSWYVHPARGCHLPAMLPILPGSDHSHETHLYRFRIDYSFQYFDGANLSDACFEMSSRSAGTCRPTAPRASSGTWSADTVAFHVRRPIPA